MSDDLLAIRREKLAALAKKGIAFPNTFAPTHSSKDCHEFDQFSKEELAEKGIEVAVAGRIMTQRLMGKAAFVTLLDGAGRIQLYLKSNDLPEGVFEDYKHWDIGDIIGAKGKLFKTKTGELSIAATSIEMITKSLQPLPDKYHGIADQEIKYRQRYLDLIMDEDARARFAARSKIISYVRNYLSGAGYLEMETPMMSAIVGGANARPFVTHHNALDMTLYMRIAPELYLKRLLVGGFEKVFELNRNFRNEGLSRRHNPEFTMVEFYSAYSNYNDLMDLTEDLLQKLAVEVTGSTDISYEDLKINFKGPFARLSVADAVTKYNPELKGADLRDRAKLAAHAKGLGIEVKDNFGWGRILTDIFEETAEAKLIDPTFIIGYPTEVSPLSRVNDKDNEITDRFELFIAGREIANGFSELNDPIDQAERFKAQVSAKEAGDDEAMHYDADYINALEVGMPPAAGEGIGIDRLVMLLTDAPSIRDVILFPHMRKQASEE